MKVIAILVIIGLIASIAVLPYSSVPGSLITAAADASSNSNIVETVQDIAEPMDTIVVKDMAEPIKPKIAATGPTNNTAIPFLTMDPAEYSNAKAKADQKRDVDVFTASAPSRPLSKDTGEVTAQVVSKGASFQGLSFDESGLFYPPDVTMATGPNYIVEMVNVNGAIFTKTGSRIQTIDLHTFFNAGVSDSLTDPKVLFDAQSGRFFASIMDISTNSVRIAISSTDDPTGSWVRYNISFDDRCPDQPIIGISNNKFIISVNSFASHCEGGFVGAEFVVLRKAELLTASPVPFQRTLPDSSEFSIHPVQSLGSTNAEFMVSTGYSSIDSVGLYTITGAVPSVTVSVVSLPIQWTAIPPGGQQRDSSVEIETNDARVTDAAWYNGKLWLSLNDACTPDGDTASRACLRLIEIDTTVPAVTQDFDYGIPGYYLFFPALSINSQGRLAVVFGYSSTGSYPSIAVTGRAPTDPSNTLQQATVVKAGSRPDESGRYGDYFDAAIDPSDTTRFWVAGEYGTSWLLIFNQWSTFISDVTITPLATSATVTVQTDKGYYVPGETVRITGKVTVDSGSVDQPILIQVLSPTDLEQVRLDEVTADADGSFSYSFPSGGPLMSIDGAYLVVVTYAGTSQTTTFDFIADTSNIPNILITFGAAGKTTKAFKPNPLNVITGDTVMWTNNDSTIHTVTSGTDGSPDGNFDSSSGGATYLAPHQTFSHTFTEAGDYPYFCLLHPNMVGSVTVIDPTDGQFDTLGKVTFTSELRLKVQDPDQNINAQLKDVIFDSVLVQTSLSGGDFEQVPMIETGRNTGVFEPDLSDNILKITFLAAGEVATENNGVLELQRSDIPENINASYFDPLGSDESAHVTSIINFQMSLRGDVLTLPDNVSVNNDFIVTLTDKDLNDNSKVKEIYTVVLDGIGPYPLKRGTQSIGQVAGLDMRYVGSHTDFGAPLNYTFTETGKNTGIFRATFDTGDILNSLGTSASDGDILQIYYIDKMAAITKQSSDTIIIAIPASSLDLSRARAPIPPLAGDVTADALGSDEVVMTLSIKDSEHNTQPGSEDTLVLDGLGANRNIAVQVDGQDFVVATTEADDNPTLKGPVELQDILVDELDGLTLTETGANTGVFSEELHFHRGGLALDDWQNLTISFVYIDNQGDEDSSAVVFRGHTGVLSTDKTVVTTGDHLTVTLKDVDLNLDGSEIEEFDSSTAADDPFLLSVETEDDEITGVSTETFRETGPNTGIFTATFEIGTDIEVIDIGTGDQATNIHFTYNDEINATGSTGDQLAVNVSVI